MSRFKKLTHTIYECKYHIVFCPKYRLRIFKGDIKEYTKQQIYWLFSKKDLIEVLELNVGEDHIHMVVSVPPKYSISSVMGYLKGKLSLRIFHRYESMGAKYWGRHLWSRGYCVSTIGIDEDKIRKYVQYQERREKDLEQSQLDI